MKKIGAQLVGVGLAMGLLFLMLVGMKEKEGVSAVSADSTFGYGFNMAAWDTGKLDEMGFNWMKVFNTPGSRLPINVLMRVHADATHFSDLNAFGDSITAMAQSQVGYVDAYEIGNEPNLDASYGWTVAPNAADYATLLCVAYDRIKAVDPAARVVSAGLAPTGRVIGNWNGHPGHNGLYQDEREFLHEFITAGGGNCLDSIGYHPYGYSADFDAEPDANLGDSTTNCSNGFCFRGAEKIYEIMQARGLGDKTMWATEFGWIVDPPVECLSDPGWQGRQWQIVSEEKQATNLAGAFQYATDHWPWMEAMFVFNLNFNLAGYPVCEQMRFYSVQTRPAETALRDLPKVTVPLIGELSVGNMSVSAMITPTQQPFTRTIPVQIENIGTAAFTYTLSVDSDTLSPTVNLMGGVVEPMQTAVFDINISSNGRLTGTYTATVNITAVPTGTLGVPTAVPVQLFVVEQIHHTYLPLINN